MRKFLLVFVFLSFLGLAFSKEVPFTQEDRDRLRSIEIKVERLEVKVEALEKRMDILQKQVDELRSDFRNYMSIVLGALLTVIVGIIALIGFILWDRRTALSPVAKKTKELEDKSDKIEKVLKDLAKRNPEIEEVLKRAGLL
jgi:chaperonin cofactor prefoldin